MQHRAVRRVDLAFERLCPVRVDLDLGDDETLRRARCPRHRLKFGHGFLGPEVRPDEAARFGDGIGLMTQVFPGPAGRRLGRHLDDRAVSGEFPAVIEAPEPSVFVARQRHAAMRAIFVDGPERAIRAAENDDVRVDDGSANGRAARGETSLARQTGSQYRFIKAPIGASPLTRHNRSFCSAVSMSSLPGRCLWHHGPRARQKKRAGSSARPLSSSTPSVEISDRGSSAACASGSGA